MSAPETASPLVLDTDVASFLIKEDPVRTPRYVRHLKGRSLVLPFSVVAELIYGAEERNWGTRRRRRMDEFIASCQIVLPDMRVCSTWARLRVVAKRAGRTVERQDAWVAAAALHLEAPLLTHNARHYSGIPMLQVITEPDPST